MGKKRGYVVSLILLFLFGLNVLAEISPNHIEPVHQHFALPNQADDAQMTSLDSQPIYPDEQSHPHSDASGNCADCSHTGRCHFGHCSYHPIRSYLTLGPLGAAYSHLSHDFLAPKFPFIEGPKRPPRQS